MKLSKLIACEIAFCFSILIAIQTNNQKPISKSAIPKAAPGQDGPHKFGEFQRQIRTPDDATSPEYEKGFLLGEMRRAQRHAQAARKNGRTQANGVLEWKERGPSNVPGRTRGLLVDPADETRNTWLAGSASGGVWKTTNAGSSWTLITLNFSNLATTVLAMSASNPNTIYVGTGESYGGINAVRGNGMFKSTDRGQTWAHLPSTSKFDDVNRAVVDPTNENIVVVATTSGIYKTKDGGSTWTHPSTLLAIEDLKATPDNFNILYATQNGVGVLKSIDAGDTWVLSNAGMGQFLRVEIAVSPVKTDRIFASCENGATPLMLVSDDAGVTWSAVTLIVSDRSLDYTGGQGAYNNTIACDPFDKDVIYFGGVDLFRTKLATTSTVAGIYSVQDEGSSKFMTLIPAEPFGILAVGPSADETRVELRFGPDLSQKAHRFLVPVGEAMSIATEDYTYENYVDVPFEVWDVTNNKQLMVSFRDQGRDGEFNLIPQDVANVDATLQSREYLYIHNVDYNADAPNENIAKAGGHEFKSMYYFWPSLATDGVWPPTAAAILRINHIFQTQYNSSTTYITDGRGQFMDRNKNGNVHVDHHNIVMIPMSATTYKILDANDGGVAFSNTSSSPGLKDRGWTSAGNSYNTSQFYGADKRPGADEYFGGMQDNGTWKSPPNTVADHKTKYTSNFEGDGFESIWHNFDDRKLIGSYQNNGLMRSVDSGRTWADATTGLSGDAPFVSKLANSRDNPDVLFTLTSAGVFRSPNFGESWLLTPIVEKWGKQQSYMDVEVSRANANKVWAGIGMSETGELRNIHVSIDGGVTFSPTNNFTEATLGPVSKLASHPTEENTAYALFSFAGKPKVLRTRNLGGIWKDISGFSGGAPSTIGFPDVAVHCLYVRTDDPNIIWVGTEIGIVESLDNGRSWALITDFPKVCVWDIKAQDDQLVIATHGRGIWTATLGTVQKSAFEKPIVEAVGTSPDSKFAVRYNLLARSDSTQVFINNLKIGKIGRQIPGAYVLKISGVPLGNVDVKLVSFKGTAPFSSAPFAGKNLKLLAPYQKQYANIFQSIEHFSDENFQLSNFGSSNQSMQTAHNYLSNWEAKATLLQPIIVDADNANFFYQDVALVQPSAAGVTFGQPDFKDYVVVEATKDGVTWIPLKDGYNAASNPQWLDAYNINQPGSPELSEDHTIDLKTKFSATDTLLFRFRLKADKDEVTGWGWSIDNLFIQQPPTGVELVEALRDISVFPNPTGGKATVQFTLLEDTQVSIETLDVRGTVIAPQVSVQMPRGKQEQPIDLSNRPVGLYYVRLRSNNKTIAVKLIKK